MDPKHNPTIKNLVWSRLQGINGVGTRLKELREQRGFSVRSFAKLLEVNPSTVSRIEQAHIKPSQALLNRIAQVLSTSIEELEELHKAEAIERTVDELPVEGRCMAGSQEWVRAREVMARELKVFGWALIPGQLQTINYMRGVFALHTEDEMLIEEACQARLRRQREFAGKKLRVVLSEFALTSRLITAQEQLDQLGRLACALRTGEADIAILPTTYVRGLPQTCSFSILDNSTGWYDIRGTDVLVQEESRVAQLCLLFERLRSLSLLGDEAMTRLAAVERALRS